MTTDEGRQRSRNTGASTDCPWSLGRSRRQAHFGRVLEAISPPSESGQQMPGVTLSQEWVERTTASTPGCVPRPRSDQLHYAGFEASFAAARSRRARSNRSLLNFAITGALPSNAFFAMPFSSSIASSTRAFASLIEAV